MKSFSRLDTALVSPAKPSSCVSNCKRKKLVSLASIYIFRPALWTNSKWMLVPSVFMSSVRGSPPLGRLICLPSPALVPWDPPWATCSWDPGSQINEQIETDSNMRRWNLDKHACLCLAERPYYPPPPLSPNYPPTHPPPLLTHLSDTHQRFVLVSHWQEVGGQQDVQQYGQNCRRS